MVTTEEAGKAGVADNLGIEPSMVVQELGWDEEVDDYVRAAVEERAGSELLDEDADEVVDVVLLWWRENDGELTAALVNAIGPLAEHGAIWVLAPKTGREGYVESSAIAEAATAAGLSQTLSTGVGDDWTGTKLVPPKSPKAKR